MFGRTIHQMNCLSRYVLVGCRHIIAVCSEHRALGHPLSSSFPLKWNRIQSLRGCELH
jgi:hypothetical protein